jgi:hypothetical protein
MTAQRSSHAYRPARLHRMDSWHGSSLCRLAGLYGYTPLSGLSWLLQVSSKTPATVLWCNRQMARGPLLRAAVISSHGRYGICTQVITQIAQSSRIAAFGDDRPSWMGSPESSYGLQRTRLLPPLPSVGSTGDTQEDWERETTLLWERGEESGKEPNHMMARKPGHL